MSPKDKAIVNRIYEKHYGNKKPKVKTISKGAKAQEPALALVRQA